MVTTEDMTEYFASRMKAAVSSVNQAVLITDWVCSLLDGEESGISEHNQFQAIASGPAEHRQLKKILDAFDTVSKQYPSIVQQFEKIECHPEMYSASGHSIPLSLPKIRKAFDPAYYTRYQ